MEGVHCRAMDITEEKSDDELIALHHEGDETALQTLIARYLDSIYNFSRRMTGNPDEASDITQETFVKVWKTLDRYRMGNTFKAWVFRVARNTAIDHLRKKRMSLFSDFDTDDGRNYLVETLADEETLPSTLIEKA